MDLLSFGMESSLSDGNDEEGERLSNSSLQESYGSYLNDTQFSYIPVYNGSSYDEFEALYEVPTGLVVLLSCLYGSVSVLAVVGNVLVMWIVATSRRMQNVTNCYIANLALADIVIGLFAIPFQFQAALLQRWVLPYFMCAFCPFVQALSVNVSVSTLTAIAVDRHRAIITPLSANTSKRVAKVVICCIWVVALAVAAPMAMSWEIIIADDVDLVTRSSSTKPFCAPSEFGSHSLSIYRLVLFIFQYFTPLCVITIAYARMALKLWGSKAPGNAQESRDANQMKNKKRVIKMLVIVVALFALCWLPLQTYFLLQSYFPGINEYKYINIMFFCFDWLAMSNSCYNPFIYAIYNEKFKKEFKQRFTFGRKKWKSAYGNDSFDADKNPSTHTRMTSVRSANESRCSTRLNYRSNAHQQDLSRLCVRPNLTWNCERLGRFNSLREKKILKQDLRPGRSFTDNAFLHEEDGLKNFSRKNNQNGGKKLDEKNSSLESISFNEDRVTELYIFPNSHLIDLKNGVQEKKL